MRCKKHLWDLSSSIGVCATCLREKLFSLIEAQIQLKSFSDDHHNHNHNHNQKQPQPLIFPRSVSPYIARRKSDQQTNKPINQRSYSTPQVNPNFSKKSSKFARKFNLISKLFRSKSDVVETSKENSEKIEPAELTRWRNRGMSPQNELDESENFDSPSTAVKTRPSPGRVKPSPGRVKQSNAGSFAFCLSPLVRASPATHYRGGSGGEPSFSGEIRVGKSTGCKDGGVNSKNPQLGEAASYCANRSRKIADFGRLNLNRNR